MGAVLATLLFAIAQFYGLRGSEFEEPFLFNLAACGCYCMTWAALTPAIAWAARRFPLRGPRRWLSVPPHLALSAFVVAVQFAGMLIFNLAWPVLKDELDLTVEQMATNYLSVYAPMNFFLYCGLVGVLSAVHVSRELHERELQASRIEGQLDVARLRALQGQIRPHFLFNTLHSVASLVRQHENERAVRMIVRLSELLRWMLDSDDRLMVSVHEELEFLEDYLAIEQERFGDRLVVDISPTTTWRTCWCRLSSCSPSRRTRSSTAWRSSTASAAWASPRVASGTTCRWRFAMMALLHRRVRMGRRTTASACAIHAHGWRRPMGEARASWLTPIERGGVLAEVRVPLDRMPLNGEATPE